MQTRVGGCLSEAMLSLITNLIKIPIDYYHAYSVSDSSNETHSNILVGTVSDHPKCCVLSAKSPPIIVVVVLGCVMLVCGAPGHSSSGKASTWMGGPC